MLKKFATIGERFAQIFKERTEFGTTPANEDALSNVRERFNFETLANLLPYESYDENYKIYINKKSQGFIFEASPLTGASEEMINILTSILTDVLPEETDMQFLLYASDKVGNILDDFERQRSGRGEIFEWLAKKRTEFIKSGIYQSLTQSGTFVIRDFRLFITISRPCKKGADILEELLQLRQDIKSSLKSINMETVDVAVEEFISFMQDLINPSRVVYPTVQNWHEFDALSRQLTDPEYCYIVRQNAMIFETEQVPEENQEEQEKQEKQEKPNYHEEPVKTRWEARALTIKDFPKTMAQWKMTDSIGQLFNSALQVPCPFLISFSTRLLNNEKANMKVQYKFICLLYTSEAETV